MIAAYLELVQDRRLSSRIEAEHEQPVLLVAEEDSIKVVVERG